MNKVRIQIIDQVRGISVIGMILYHSLFIMNMSGLFAINMQNPFIDSLGWLVRCTFITLAGISLTLSSNQNSKFWPNRFKRSLEIIFAASIVSLATFIWIPKLWIKFGILHFLGISTLIAAPFRQKPLLSLAIGSFILLFSPYLNALSGSNYLAYSFGLKVTKLGGALDYFPFFPWLSLIFFGIMLGNLTRKSLQKINLTSQSGLLEKISSVSIFCGKNALVIYLIHPPIIFIGLEIIKIFQ